MGYPSVETFLDIAIQLAEALLRYSLPSGDS